MDLAQDDRPIAVRRKRRSSTCLGDPRAKSEDGNTKSMDSASDSRPTPNPKTPTKSKKRVRFSDPGPESSTVASSSTGLTPALKRTTLAPSVSLGKLRRRSSMPAQLSTPSPSPASPVFSAPPMSGEVQFAPLRQILDPRTARRLKRNHLSEEQNDIHDSIRTGASQRDEIQALKEEIASIKESRAEGSPAVDGQSRKDVQVEELENEIAKLKQEMRERSATPAPLFMDDDVEQPATPASSDYGNIPDEDFEMVNVEGCNDGGHSQTATVSTATVTHSSAQAVLPDPSLATVFRSARLSLERLFPGETPLGLDVSNPQQILDAMLARIQALKAELSIAGKSLSAKEAQEMNIRNQFNSALAQLERARNYGETLSAEMAKEKARADKAEQKSDSRKSQLQDTKVKMNEAEMEASRSERSIRRLQDATKKYEKEVNSLEKLITEMESSHQAEIFKLRDSLTADFNNTLRTNQARFDDETADWQCRVAAETAGRRAAEQCAVERVQRIKQLETLEQELRNTMGDKQRTIRELDAMLQKMEENKEQEVGALNVKISKMANELQKLEEE
ncbi:MAG: hypothetical protein Q9190_007903, partial [Brigantiaea leucoxantha]